MQKIKASFGDNGSQGKHKLEIDGEAWLDTENDIQNGISEINVNLKADSLTSVLIRMEMKEADIDAEGVIRINALVFDEDQARSVYETLKERFEP